ncbi:hypothetical protein [Blautia sp. An81]|uniref:hypothetical protein n=1 Tax=Blautia sp. An81 TaxID=1965659 RepID=UPI00194FC680|nr:hypothetical protein [Blautia sp. An81]
MDRINIQRWLRSANAYQGHLFSAIRFYQPYRDVRLSNENPWMGEEPFSIIETVQDRIRKESWNPFYSVQKRKKEENLWRNYWKSSI